MAYTVSRFISDDTLNRFIHVESDGDPDARAKTSSAEGLLQFTKKTWRDTVARHKPEWLSLPAAELLDLRRDAQAAIEMGARLTEDNARALGDGASDGDLYLAHFFGSTTARKVAHAAASLPIADVVSARVIVANKKILTGKTVGQVRAWAAKKMAGAGGRNYVAKFWRGGYQLAAAEPQPDAAQEPQAVEPAESIPLPGDLPAGAPSFEDDVAALAAERVRPTEPSDYSVEYVQRRLRELGYFTVGRADGSYGSYVRGAIVRFKHDKGLEPEDANITPAFLAVLRDPACAPAPISEARANASASDLTEQNPTLWALAWQKLVALATAIGTFFMAAVNWLYEKVGSDFYLVDRIGGVVAKMPLWGWLGIAGGVCLVGLALVRRGERDQVEKYQRGELL